MGSASRAQTICLSLGSNVGDREGNLRAAVSELAEKVEILAVSSVYETAPIGVTDQPEFLNLALVARTQLAPHHLLALLKGIERSVGRVPTYRWGPRVVDLDLLLYGELVMDSPDLVIPHREMHRRAFVLMPLAEIAPDAMHPVLGKSIQELLGDLDTSGVRVVGPYHSENRSSAHGSPSL